MSGRKTFVCYRREDSSGHAGRIYDRLNRRFPGRVFMDVAGIGLGTRWAEVIEQTLASCEVVLLLIGRRWLERDADGRRRLDNPDDPLRAEITTALSLERRIVPVLVGGAALPDRAALPPDVAPALDWQALRVDDDDFDHDVARLVSAIEALLQEAPDDPHLEQQEARRAQVEALFADSAAAARAGQWVTAAQTLRAVLSLEPGNARASAELRDVEARWAAAYREGQRRQQATASARPRWAVYGAVGVLAAAGVLGAIALVVVLALLDPAPSPIADDYAPQQGSLHEESDDGSPGQGSVTSPLVGTYELKQFMAGSDPYGLSGRLTLIDAGAGQLRFETHASDGASVTYWNTGLLWQQGGRWSISIEDSSEGPSSGPMPVALQFDGSRLSVFTQGETWVWQKQ